MATALYPTPHGNIQRQSITTWIKFDETPERTQVEGEIVVQYRINPTYKPKRRDWIGLFVCGSDDRWDEMSFIAYEWAPKYPKNSRARHLAFHCQIPVLLANGTTYFRLLYITKYGDVIGCSQKFRIKAAVSALRELHDSEAEIIQQQNSTEGQNIPQSRVSPGLLFLPHSESDVRSGVCGYSGGKEAECARRLTRHLSNNQSMGAKEKLSLLQEQVRQLELSLTVARAQHVIDNKKYLHLEELFNHSMEQQRAMSTLVEEILQSLTHNEIDYNTLQEISDSHLNGMNDIDSETSQHNGVETAAGTSAAVRNVVPRDEARSVRVQRTGGRADGSGTSTVRRSRTTNILPRTNKKLQWNDLIQNQPRLYTGSNYSLNKLFHSAAEHNNHTLRGMKRPLDSPEPQNNEDASIYQGSNLSLRTLFDDLRRPKPTSMQGNDYTSSGSGASLLRLFHCESPELDHRAENTLSATALDHLKDQNQRAKGELPRNEFPTASNSSHMTIGPLYLSRDNSVESSLAAAGQEIGLNDARHAQNVGSDPPKQQNSRTDKASGAQNAYSVTEQSRHPLEFMNSDFLPDRQLPLFGISRNAAVPFSSHFNTVSSSHDCSATAVENVLPTYSSLTSAGFAAALQKDLQNVKFANTGSSSVYVFGKNNGMTADQLQSSLSDNFNKFKVNSSDDKSKSSNYNGVTSPPMYNSGSNRPDIKKFDAQNQTTRAAVARADSTAQTVLSSDTKANILAAVAANLACPYVGSASRLQPGAIACNCFTNAVNSFQIEKHANNLPEQWSNLLARYRNSLTFGPSGNLPLYGVADPVSKPRTEGGSLPSHPANRNPIINASHLASAAPAVNSTAVQGGLYSVSGRPGSARTADSNGPRCSDRVVRVPVGRSEKLDKVVLKKQALLRTRDQARRKRPETKVATKTSKKSDHKHFLDIQQQNSGTAATSAAATLSAAMKNFLVPDIASQTFNTLSTILGLSSNESCSDDVEEISQEMVLYQPVTGIGTADEQFSGPANSSATSEQNEASADRVKVPLTDETSDEERACDNAILSGDTVSADDAATAGSNKTRSTVTEISNDKITQDDSQTSEDTETSENRKIVKTADDIQTLAQLSASTVNSSSADATALDLRRSPNVDSTSADATALDVDHSSTGSVGAEADPHSCDLEETEATVTGVSANVQQSANNSTTNASKSGKTKKKTKKAT